MPKALFHGINIKKTSLADIYYYDIPTSWLYKINLEISEEITI